MRYKIELKMNGKVVSNELSRYLETLSYREALDGEADTLEVTLQDAGGLFRASWFPPRGATLEAIVIGEYEQMPLGRFYIDEIENSYPPSECKIKATSIPPASTVKAAEKWRSWESVTLSKIAGDIASGSDLKLYFEADYDPVLDRAEQSDESDLQFLHRLCKDNGLALKLNDQQLIIFDIEEYEKRDAVNTYQRISARVKRFSARCTLNEVYSSCEVNFDDGGKELPFTGISQGVMTMFGGATKTLKVNKRVKSIGEAQRLAKKKLKEKNRKETKINLTMLGDFTLRAGNTIELDDFAIYNGKYLIQKATHTVGNGGYETSIEVTKVG